MAGLAAESLREQCSLVAWLRWRLFVNGLRSRAARFDLIGRAIAIIFGSGLVLVVGLLVGAGSFAMAARGGLQYAAFLLWGIFLFWHLFPVALSWSAAHAEFRNLLRFPIRYPAFFFLNLAYGLFDPASLAALFWIFCMAAGLALGRPGLLLWIPIVLGVFAAMNLLLGRMISSWLERLLARRRTREALFAIFILAVLLLQFSGVIFQHWGKRLVPWVSAVLPAVQLLPPGQAARALQDAVNGSATAALSEITVLAGYALLFGLLLSWRLRRQYRGEDLSESRAPQTTNRASRARVASAVTGRAWLPSGPAGAVAEKELRYMLRNTATLLNLCVPLILIAFFAVTWNLPRNRPDFFARLPSVAFPAGVGYMFLLVAQMSHNCFGYDGRGIQTLFFSPARFREVLFGKNFSLAIVLVVETFLVWLLISLLVAPPDAVIVVITLPALAFAALVHWIAGNWLSVQFPRRFEFGRQRQRPSGVTLLVGFALQAAILGVAALVVLLAKVAGSLWLAALVFLALFGGLLPLYSSMLDRTATLALRQRETLIDQLTRAKSS